MQRSDGESVFTWPAAHADTDKLLLQAGAIENGPYVAVTVGATDGDGPGWGAKP